MGYPRFDKYFNPGFEKDYLYKKFKCDPKRKLLSGYQHGVIYHL